MTIDEVLASTSAQNASAIPLTRRRKWCACISPGVPARGTVTVRRPSSARTTSTSCALSWNARG